MSVRIMMLEWRRGAGAPLAAVTAVGGLLLAVVAAATADGQTPWSGSVPGVLFWLNSIGLLLGPLVAASGAWAGSRERRLQVDELLAAVPRARWRRDGTSLTTLAVAMTAGLGAVLAAVTTSVLPVLSYGGGRWALSALVMLAGYGVCLLLGFAAGRLVPSRWTPPLVAFAVYLLCGLSTYVDSGAGQLAPVANLPAGDGQRLDLSVAGQAAVWLVSCGACLFLLASSRRRRWALVPAVVAAVVAVPLVALPWGWTGSGYTAAWTEPDPGALTRVCTTGGPRVCLNRVHEKLLPAVTDVVGPVLAELPPGSFAAERGIEHPAFEPVREPGQLVIPFLQGHAAPFSAGLRDRDALRAEIVGGLFTVWCPERSPAVERASGIAATLIPAGAAAAPAEDPVAARLASDTAARRAWIGGYLAASSSCDLAAFDELVAA
jgi:hypothetical protein